MIKYNPVTKEKGECIIVGRAATAIYLVLSHIRQENKYVVVPANICYAAVFPIMSAGLKPLFCDVDKYSGNITVESLRTIINDDVLAVITPHMYGNPVKNLVEIKRLLNKRGIMLIEDCASLMTNRVSDYLPGTVGDYIIYSTGYSKTIDNGIGGLLFSSSHSLVEIEHSEDRLPLYRAGFALEIKLFSKIYRIIRNQRYQSELCRCFFDSLRGTFGENFLYRISDDQKKMVLDSLDSLDEIIERRNYQYNIYKLALEKEYELYSYEKQSVPWRFSFFVENDRDRFVEYCLENSLPVSDWYPCVTPIFGIDTPAFPNAQWHEKHIINFPLLIPDENIYRICECLNNYGGNELNGK